MDRNLSGGKPLSGGLHEASIRGAIGERLHIYIVHYSSHVTDDCTEGFQMSKLLRGLSKYVKTQPFLLSHL